MDVSQFYFPTIHMYLMADRIRHSAYRQSTKTIHYKTKARHIQGDSELLHNTYGGCWVDHFNQKMWTKIFQILHRFDLRRFYADVAVITVTIEFYKMETIRFHMSTNFLVFNLKNENSALCRNVQSSLQSTYFRVLFCSSGWNLSAH